MKAKSRTLLSSLLDGSGKDLMNARDIKKAFSDAGAKVEDNDHGFTIKFDQAVANVTLNDGDPSKCRRPDGADINRVVSRLLGRTLASQRP